MTTLSCDLRIGTSGFDYPEWRGVLYPENLPREEFLPTYAANFSTVELNFAYYRIPREEQLEGMLERGGPGLDFSIKAHESLTHNVDPASWKDAVAEYRKSIRPLLRSGRLVAVLLQFPYSFHYDADRRKYLDSLIRELDGVPLVVEFRNGAWHTPRVLEALQKRNVGFCATDMPDLKGLPGRRKRSRLPLRTCGSMAGTGKPGGVPTRRPGSTTSIQRKNSASGFLASSGWPHRLPDSGSTSTTIEKGRQP